MQVTAQNKQHNVIHKAEQCEGKILRSNLEAEKQSMVVLLLYGSTTDTEDGESLPYTGVKNV